MSVITVAVLRMPDDMFWNDHPLYRAQHNAARKHAADELERLQGENEAMKIKLNAVQAENPSITELKFSKHVEQDK